MSNVFLFTGPNAYAIAEEVARWRREFIKRHGEENQQLLDADGLDPRSFLDDVSAAPFLAEKRMVIVRGIPKWTKEHVTRMAEDIHPHCVVVFVESAPDKRLAGTKALLSIADVKAFPLLSERELRSWIGYQFCDRDAAIAPDAADHLLRTVGSDQHALEQEIEKLTLGALSRTVTRGDIDRLSVPSSEEQVWALTDCVLSGKRQEALRLASDLIHRGEDAFSVWSILLWMLRSFVAVFAAVLEGERNPVAIAGSVGAHPQSVRRMLAFAEKVDRQTLRALVDWAAHSERELKTGGIRSTQEAPQEILALIDAFIVRSTGLVAH